ncbi:MAG: hypothetical protein FWC80_01685 [Firmicutes bacterium]|nr:hypothetical protein [Bacillota bacterium]
MKKKIILSLFTLLIVSFAFVSCRCGTTVVTQHPREHQFAIDYPIRIYDIETGNHLATLTFTDISLLIDEEWEQVTINEETGDTTTRTFRQIVQIFYTYDRTGGGRTIGSGNFTTRDGSGSGNIPAFWSGVSAVRVDTTGFDNSQAPDFTSVSRPGQSSFTVALANRSNFVDIEFRYNIQRNPTARIRLNVPQV